jgi:hypothetical protein
VPTSAHKTRWWSTGGPWGTGLLLLGIGVTMQGVAYLIGDPTELNPALRWVNHGIPIRAWALVWITAGAYSILRALTPPQKHTDVAPVVGIISLWAAIYLVFWIYNAWHGHVGREWTATVAWASLGALVVSWSRCVNPPTGRGRRR